MDLVCYREGRRTDVSYSQITMVLLGGKMDFSI